MDGDLYLERISYSGGRTPAFETLCQLQASHLLNVPFENLDIIQKTPIDLANSFQKIVGRYRGGFCYELNGLFYQLLKLIGYQVKMISARVYSKDKSYGPEFDHLAIIANVNDADWLVDVGFGEFALHPLRIAPGVESRDPRGLFRIDAYDQDHLLVRKKNTDGEWVPEYKFTSTERQLDDFANMCLYHQTNANSHFTQKRICSLPTETGRISLTGNVLKITSGNSVTERELTGEAELGEVLRKYFRINLFA